MNTQRECPICHGLATRFESKEHGPFWKCTGECQKFFPDHEGEIVLPVDCPKCHAASSLYRYRSQRLRVFYWKCESCLTFFNDEDGCLGAEFSDE